MEDICILWDWNGTLVDDCAVGLEAFNRVLEEHGKERTTRGFYRSHITTPISAFYSLFFDLDRIPFAELDSQFNRHYARLAERLSLTEGIVLVLEQCRDSGIRQAILTSSWAHVVEQNARLLGARDFFDAVLGARAITDGKKTDRARSYLAEHGISPERCMVIGDTVHDFEVAKELGTRCILCGFGHQAEEVLASCGVAIAHNAAEVLALIRETGGIG